MRLALIRRQFTPIRTNTLQPPHGTGGSALQHTTTAQRGEKKENTNPARPRAAPLAAPPHAAAAQFFGGIGGGAREARPPLASACVMRLATAARCSACAWRWRRYSSIFLDAVACAGV